MCCHSRSKTRPTRVLIVGSSNSGKTTLIERLIPMLRRRGLRVGTVKHAHQGFEMDHPGKDSWRHARAGADAVAIVSPTRAAWLVQTAGELTTQGLIERMRADIDLVLVEGFKRSQGSKILLGSSGNSRVDIDEGSCRIGVLPDQLTADELEHVAQFCVRHAWPSATDRGSRCPLR